MRKYEVIKLANPEKEIDAIVLEFDDMIAQKAIRFWADLMARDGFEKCAHEVNHKLDGMKSQFNHFFDLCMIDGKTKEVKFLGDITQLRAWLNSSDTFISFGAGDIVNKNHIKDIKWKSIKANK